MNLEQKRIIKKTLLQAAFFGFIGGIIGSLTMYYFIVSRGADTQSPLTGGQVLEAAWPKFSEERKDAIAAAIAAAIEATDPALSPQPKSHSKSK